jgi:protein-S-isoprenylcysteine O-methyltransferase Ste14
MPVLASAYLQSVAMFILAGIALFGSAGTLALPTYWVYLALFLAVIVVSFAILPADLIRERMRPGGQRAPLSLFLFTLALLGAWIVAGLDHGRFHWSDSVPPWVQWLSLAVIAAGNALALWAMAVNRFFSSVVRIQSDRGQHVVASGPYGFIRHPGYLAGILFMAASGPALNSWLATALFVAISLPFLLYRTITEDRILKAELPGYRDYAQRVRWRLIPGIW